MIYFFFCPGNARYGLCGFGLLIISYALFFFNPVEIIKSAVSAHISFLLKTIGCTFDAHSRAYLCIVLCSFSTKLKLNTSVFKL